MKLGGHRPPGHDALLFSMWHRNYMPSRTDTAGPTKAFIYPVMDHWEEGKSKRSGTRQIQNRRRFSVEHANHQTTMTAPSQRSGLLAVVYEIEV